METFRGFKAIPQNQHLKGNSGLHPNIKRGFIFKKGQGYSDFSQKRSFQALVYLSMKSSHCRAPV